MTSLTSCAWIVGRLASEDELSCPPSLEASTVIFKDSLPSGSLSSITFLTRTLSSTLFGLGSPIIMSFPFSSFGLFWLNEHVDIVQIQCVNRKRSLLNLHTRKYQSSFINGRLYLPTENITIISCMRKRIMPLTICMPLLTQNSTH